MTLYRQAKKVVCTLMAIGMTVNTMIQPVLATGNVLAALQVQPAPTTHTSLISDAVQITADVVGTAQPTKLPPKGTTVKQTTLVATDALMSEETYKVQGDPA